MFLRIMKNNGKFCFPNFPTFPEIRCTEKLIFKVVSIIAVNTMTTPAQIDSSDTTIENPTKKPSRWYRCLSCGAPSPEFYFRYGEETSKNNIQLTECGVCHAVVDPYMEKEWLLVVMDLILLRKIAFRHVYWNRLDTKYLMIHRELTPESVSSIFLPLLIFVPWITLMEHLKNSVSKLFVALQRAYSLTVIGSASSTNDFIEEHDLFLLTEIFLIASMYIWTWMQRPQHGLPGFRYWHMVHCAIWVPLCCSSLVGWMVSRIWNNGGNHESVGSLSWEVAHQVYYLGLGAWVFLWQVSGIQVVSTKLPASMEAESP